MSKRRISAQKLVTDIKSKVTYGFLIEKYSLSESDLDILLQRLVSSGTLKREELPDKGHPSQSSPSSLPAAELSQDAKLGLPSEASYVSCPRCGTAYSQGPTVCTKCGSTFGDHDPRANLLVDEHTQNRADDVGGQTVWKCYICGTARTDRTGACPGCGVKSATMPSREINPQEAAPAQPPRSQGLSGEHLTNPSPRSPEDDTEAELELGLGNKETPVIVSGLSGNEIYCLSRKGWSPGGVVVGNSVQSLGLLGGIAGGLRAIAGGEIDNLTRLISAGRHAAIQRLEKEAKRLGAHGVAGVTSDLRSLGRLHEFIAIGSAINKTGYTGSFFTTACTGQELYCQLDAGYEPLHFVMGNVAYAFGVGRGFLGLLSGLAGGEIIEYSQMYNNTRHLALERLEEEALERGANAVVDIHTHMLPLGIIAREMLMVGTASHHAAFGTRRRPVTSGLTGEELWNLTRLGYAPLRLLLATSVYSLGIVRGIGALFQSLAQGEVNSVTALIYEARANCMKHIRNEANALGADAVIGTKVFIFEIGSSVVEVMAIGTAIKKVPGLTVRSQHLISQAVIRDRDTFFDHTSIGMTRRDLD